MKIVRAQVGATCVAVPARGVVFVDPNLTHPDAVRVVRATLPRVHPDVVAHWIETVIPTAEPLGAGVDSSAAARMAIVRSFTPPLSRGKRFAGGLKKRSASLTTAVIVGIASVVVMGLGGGEPTPAVAADAFDSPAFSSVKDRRGFTCAHVDEGTLRCVTADGVEMLAEAKVHKDATEFQVDYAADGGWVQPVKKEASADSKAVKADRLAALAKPRPRRMHKNTIVAFHTPEAATHWVEVAAALEEPLHPNLIVGDQWVVFGTDSHMVDLWGDALGGPAAPEGAIPPKVPMLEEQQTVEAAPRPGRLSRPSYSHNDSSVGGPTSGCLLGRDSDQVLVGAGPARDIEEALLCVGIVVQDSPVLVEPLEPRLQADELIGRDVEPGPAPSFGPEHDDRVQPSVFFVDEPGDQLVVPDDAPVEPATAAEVTER